MEQLHETPESLGADPQDAKGKSRGRRGFALVAALLLLLLISGVAVAMLVMVNTETTAGANDLQSNIAYVAASGSIEKMTADLSSVFTNIQAPRLTDLNGVPNCSSSLPGVSFPSAAISTTGCIGTTGCNLCVPVDANGNMVAGWGSVKSGPNQGLYAQIIPITFSVTAQALTANQVRAVRTSEIALIPAFQFGMFADGDLDFFSSPDMNFIGRVQTNGDLYLGVSDSATLTFGDKLSAYGNVIRATLPNGLSSSGNNNGGTVMIPTVAGGCAGTQPACRALASNEGSVVGGPNSAQTANWQAISAGSTNYKSMIIDGNYGRTNGTGAKCLTLPFVGGGVQACPTGPGQPIVTTGAYPYELIRRPPAGESTGSPVSQSRMYNMADIRVLLNDDPAELPGGASDANNIRLANVQTIGTAPDYSAGVPTPVVLAASPNGYPTLISPHAYVTYFAEASTAIQDSSAWTATTSPTTPVNCLPSDWNVIPQTPATMASATYNWPLMNYHTLPLPVITGNTPAFTTFNGGGTVPSNYAARAPYISGSTASGAQLAPPNCWATAAQNVGTTTTTPGVTTTQNHNNLAAATQPATPTTWNLIDGYIRVEYLGNDGAYHPVTKEWIELGFARGLLSPNPSNPNTVNPNAILIFQAPADRDGDGKLLLPNGT
jgi:hypothetical protein